MFWDLKHWFKAIQLIRGKVGIQTHFTYSLKSFNVAVIFHSYGIWYLHFPQAPIWLKHCVAQGTYIFIDLYLYILILFINAAIIYFDSKHWINVSPPTPLKLSNKNTLISMPLKLTKYLFSIVIIILCHFFLVRTPTFVSLNSD